ncbi:MAG: phosphotransferase family protein [Woeseiaceae bacterium]|nr:phosphotransferase family protein [Woeseiaceae bacterium]
MSSPLDPRAALAVVPGWNPSIASIEELKGGLTNRTFRVTYEDAHYALRLDVEGSDILRFDRTCEATIMHAAHASGIGPEVVYVDAEAGILLSRFLPGRTWAAQDIESDHQLDRLADLLRAVHRLPICGNRVHYSKEAAAYETFLGERQGLHTFASRCLDIVRSTPDRGIIACCHNDIIARNIIDNGVIKLIDWEYASDNDPLFDIACVIGFHELDDRQADYLLDAYAGGAGTEERERLAEQQRTYDALHWLWFAARQLVLPDAAQVIELERLQQRIR